jgi:hypothetical protein
MRRVLIGPAQEGALNATQHAAEALNQVLHLKSRVANVRWVVVASLAQAGIDRLDVLEESEVPTHVQGRLKKRVHVGGEEGWIAIYDHVHQMFELSVDASYDWLHDPMDVNELEVFIVELLYSLKTHSDAVWLSPLPSIERYRPHVSPDLLIPISTLLSSMNRLNPTALAPQRSICRSDILLFDEVLDSMPFQAYSNAHAQLNDSSTKLTRASAAITAAANAVHVVNKMFLTRRRVVTHVITATARLVDLIGSTSGVIANLVANLLNEHVESRNRMVIYHLDELLMSCLGLERLQHTTAMRRGSTPRRV